MLFLLSADLKKKMNNLGIPSECQAVSIQVKPNDLDKWA